MPPPTSAQLGAAVRLLRCARKLSIEDLAADARLHYTTVSRIENGKQSPTWRAVRKLAWALEVEIADLARLAAKQPMSSPEPL